MKTVAEERTLPDLMSRNVHTISPSTTLAEAAKLASAKNLHQIVIAEDDRRFVGILPVKQLVRILRQSAESGDPQAGPASPVSSVLKPLEISASIGSSLDDVQHLLMTFSVEIIPIVDRNNRVVGTVDVLQILRQSVASASGDPEPSFKFASTKIAKARKTYPAYFRRSSGSLVLPIDSLSGVPSDVRFARLGYDDSTERVLVQLSDRASQGAVSVRKENMGREGDYFVIPAADFLRQFGVDGHGRAYDVSSGSQGIILTPRK